MASMAMHFSANALCRGKAKVFKGSNFVHHFKYNFFVRENHETSHRTHLLYLQFQTVFMVVILGVDFFIGLVDTIHRHPVATLTKTRQIQPYLTSLLLQILQRHSPEKRVFAPKQ
jgi:hypothetical protein